MRVRRNYVEGSLDVEDWQQFRQELDDERDATAARLERLPDREQELALEAGPPEEAYDRLARLRGGSPGG